MMTIVGGRFLLRRRCRRWTVVPGIARCLHTPHHEPPVVKEFVQIREDVHGRTRFYRPSADKTSIDWTWDTETQDIGRAGVAWRLLPAPLREWVRTLLLPVGYPSSVHSSYARVHVLQALETYIWSTVSVLCSQTMLESLGVASSAVATGGGAVAIQWVLKDGIGEIGKLFLIQRFARSFDSHPKTWKMVGEVASVVGATLQLSTVLFPGSWFLGLASIGYMLRAIHFSIYNATHMTFTRSFAQQGNVGDLVAKDDSQMTVAHLVGICTGVGLLTISHSHMFLFGTFFLLVPVHVAATVALLRAAKFEELSANRVIVLASQFVRICDAPGDQPIWGLDDVEERMVGFGEWIKPGFDAPHADLGVPIAHSFQSTKCLETAINVFKEENYMIGYNAWKSRFGIVYRQAATHLDIAKSLLHLTRFAFELQSSSKAVGPDPVLTHQVEMLSALEWTRRLFPKFMVELDTRGWDIDNVFWEDNGCRAEWK